MYRLQKVMFLALEITNSKCIAGSRINGGLTKIPIVLGGESNSYFLKDSLVWSWLWDLLHFWSLSQPSGYLPFPDARLP